MDIIASLLRNKYFWIAIAVIIILVIVHRNWNVWKDKLLDQKNPSYSVDSDGNVMQVTKLDEQRLDKLVVNVRKAVTNTFGMVYDDFKPLLDLTDQELEYVAKKYKSSFGVSLYTDIDDEYLPFTGGDEELMARLDKLGYKN